MRLETVQEYARTALAKWGEGSACEAIYLGDDEIDRPLCVVRCCERSNVQGGPFEFLPWLSLAALDVGLGDNAVSSFFGYGKPATVEEAEELVSRVIDPDEVLEDSVKLHMFAETRFVDRKVQLKVRFFPFIDGGDEVVFVEDPDVPDEQGSVPMIEDALNEKWHGKGYKVSDFVDRPQFTPKNLAARWAAWLDVCIGTIRMMAWVDPAVKHVLETGQHRGEYAFDPIDEAGLHRVRLQDDEPPASPVGGW